jgi:hypothetical protein
VEQKADFLCVDLTHSDDSFVIAFPSETTEAFLEGHRQAFEYFGGVRRTIHYDSTRIAMSKIAGDGERFWRGGRPVMDTPQVLLEHYLKQLKLPTMLREYVKLVEQSAKEGAAL